MKRRLINFKIGLILVCLLLLIEVLLRVVLGFCNAVLYKEDKDLEYIAIPQSRYRFGNRIFYNSFSQRNSEITSKDSIVIAGLGDSVINGGTLTSNEELATTKLSKYLSEKTGKSVKVLNISCQSWGPDNCYAYLKKYGDFNAKAMFLVMSSHDVHDLMNNVKVVGEHPGWPDEQYIFAINELITRYLIPKIFPSSDKNSLNDNLGIGKIKSDSTFNPGILDLFNYSKLRGIPFLIYLHADREEFEKMEYSLEGRKLISFCEQNKIPLVKELDYNLPVDAYRDGIHFSNLGQEEMFQILKDKVYK